MSQAHADLERAIETAWEERDAITPQTGGETRAAIETTLNALDGGTLRVAERGADGVWHVNQWAKKAVLPFAPEGPDALSGLIPETELLMVCGFPIS